MKLMRIFHGVNVVQVQMMESMRTDYWFDKSNFWECNGVAKDEINSDRTAGDHGMVGFNWLLLDCMVWDEYIK